MIQTHMWNQNNQGEPHCQALSHCEGTPFRSKLHEEEEMPNRQPSQKMSEFTVTFVVFTEA